MKFLADMRTLLVLAVLVAFAASISPALNGCATDTGNYHASETAAAQHHRAQDNDSSELARFNAVFITYASDPQNTRQLAHFRDAYRRIRSAYVEEVPGNRLIDAAIDGVRAKNPEPGSLSASQLVEEGLDAMTTSLDPHSAYLNAEELRESEMVTSGEFGGLGIQVTQEDGRIKIISPIEGTPADKAGLKPGDVITAIDGRPLDGMSLREAVNAMRGEPGSRIRLTIQREKTPPRDVTIVRAIITIEPLRWRLEGNVGYLRIVSFNEKVADGVEHAIRDMRRQTHNRLQGLVIDLRNNPGGLLDQSLAVADDFLNSGTIVSIKGREIGSDRAFRAERGDLMKGLPVVVLINAGSASASEIVAGALQDHHRATIIGTRSFGKGSVQTVMRLPVEGALKLTTALYYTPSGEAIQARGVIPDIALTGADTGGDDSHEADLPGALPAQGAAQHVSQGSVDVKVCPAVGEADDRELGCALTLLQAGSTADFLASLGANTRL